MATKFPELFGALSAPFADDQTRTRPGGGGVQLKYITATTVMDRLDETLGSENWWDRYEMGRDNSVICILTIRLPDGQEVTKQGIGVTSATVSEDAEKAGASDSLKRAAVKFGIGRYLYHEGPHHHDGRGRFQTSGSTPGSTPTSQPTERREARPGSYGAWLDTITSEVGAKNRFDLHKFLTEELIRSQYEFHTDEKDFKGRFGELAAMYESHTNDEWFQYQEKKFREFRGKKA